jgi:arylsulfatase A-like enzyme
VLRRYGTRPQPRSGHALSCRRWASAAAGLALLAGMTHCTREPAGPPNLLLLTVDTLRADRLACYGGDPDVGREICALAEGGKRFDWAIATAPYTAPSIASALTSQYPGYHGVGQSAVSYLRKETLTVAELLSTAGYGTAAFVSNPVLDRGRNFDQGFEVYDQRMTRQERNRPGYTERDAEATADATLAWARVAAHRPWFIWVHFQDPHGPYEPPDSPAARDDPKGTRLEVQEDHSGLGGIPAYQALPGLFTTGAYERRYLDEIRYLDAHVKRLVEGLDALGDPPAVLLTADHGEAFGEDGYYFVHGHSVGLDQIRIPLLWRPPRPAPAAAETAPVSLVDVAPTLLHLAGVEIPAEFQGRPLPLAGTGRRPEQAQRPIFSEHSHRAAVIVGDVYYARDRRPIGPGERDRISGGPILPIPRRTARLSAQTPLPAYASAEAKGSSESLEAELAGFLDATRDRRGATRSELPDGAQEHLRALGYLE